MLRVIRESRFIRPENGLPGHREKIMEDTQVEWERLTPEEKRRELFRKQKKTLDLFLENGAISEAQYRKSLGDLIDKMGMQGVE